ncbi:MAG: RNA-binding S4 domain-containing protein [Acidobacteria bacterium]|nr:RNA-binding S4 domain-containing protein [Acidobacteriota bacterium]
MRLDIFLKLSRLIPRRTLAQEYCEKGLIAVNGVQAKPSKEVKLGDEIEIRRRNSRMVARVREVPSKKQVSKAGANDLFELVSSETLENDQLA